MRRPCDGAHDQNHRNARSDTARAPTPTRLAATSAVVLAVALAAAGCGGSSTPPGVRDATGSPTATSAAGRLLAYARCMRGHGIADFPDPVTSGGRHASIHIAIGQGSDLNPDAPAFEAAARACRSLLPSGDLQPSGMSPGRLADELRWASCLRSHGLLGFPDPNGQGAFDYVEVKRYVAQFEAGVPVAVRAAHACRSDQPGSIPATTGSGT